MKFKVIFASVKTDITDTVVDAAKTAGATGATIIPARGTRMKEAKAFSRAATGNAASSALSSSAVSTTYWPLVNS